MTSRMRLFQQLDHGRVHLFRIVDDQHVGNPRHRTGQFCFFGFVIERPVAEIETDPQFFGFDIDRSKLSIVDY